MLLGCLFEGVAEDAQEEVAGIVVCFGVRVTALMEDIFQCERVKIFGDRISQVDNQDKKDTHCIAGLQISKHSNQSQRY